MTTQSDFPWGVCWNAAHYSILDTLVLFSLSILSGGLLLAYVESTLTLMSLTSLPRAQTSLLSSRPTCTSVPGRRPASSRLYCTYSSSARVSAVRLSLQNDFSYIFPVLLNGKNHYLQSCPHHSWGQRSSPFPFLPTPDQRCLHFFFSFWFWIPSKTGFLARYLLSLPSPRPDRRYSYV